MRFAAAGMRRSESGSGVHRGPRARAPFPAVVGAFLAFVMFAAPTGCARRGPAPFPAPPGRPATRPGTPAPPSRPRPKPGYVARADSLDSVDASVLQGRRIAIDPGHGGYFKGSVGVGGLTEAEVNLAVGLRLRDLLVARGAEVRMTRETDRDFLTPADSSLKADLTERTRIANEFAPDVFVSIHHNADPGGLHDVNETQTYYKLGDEGPSYDVATDVHRSLVRNIGIEAQRMLPGNFAVVRGSEAPALLTESSYLTNPDVEAKLRTPEAQQLEAEALYLGLARFFARRAPVIEEFAALGADGHADTLFTGSPPALRALVRGPFDAVTLRIDGIAVPATVSGDRVQWTGRPPLAGGAHEATLSARLATEGNSRARRLAFRMVKPPRRILLDAAGGPDWDGKRLQGIRVRVLDADDLPASEDCRVRVAVLGAHLLAPAETSIVVHDGIGWAYFRRARGALATRVHFTIAASIAGSAREPVSRGLLAIRRDPSLTGVATGFAIRMPEDAPLVNAPGTAGAHPALEWLNRDGFVALPADSGRARVPRLPGFRRWGAESEWPPRFVAIAGGALQGHRVVLDAEGGGDDPAGMGPSGVRAATLNLEVARALAAMLEAAGADVKLTREGDASVSEVERVQLSEGFHAERYLRIGHAAAPPVAGHYFSSAAGRRWGQHVAEACAQLGLADSLRVAEVAKYPLTQTSAVALYASLARVDSAASESRLLAPGLLRTEAYALFVALAREFAPDAAWPPDSLELRGAAGQALAGTLVTLGGALVVQSGADGRVRFVRTEPGPIEAFVQDPKAAWRILLIDSTGGRLPSGAR